MPTSGRGLILGCATGCLPLGRSGSFTGQALGQLSGQGDLEVAMASDTVDNIKAAMDVEASDIIDNVKAAVDVEARDTSDNVKAAVDVEARDTGDNVKAPGDVEARDTTDNPNGLPSVGI